MKRWQPTLILYVAIAAGATAEPDSKPGKSLERGRRGHEFASQFFTRLDKDGDQAVSEEEFGANPRLDKASPEQRAKLFRRVDKNGDGLIRRNEFKPPSQHGLSRSKAPLWLENGPVDFETFSQLPRVQKLAEPMRRRLFKRLDRNQDEMLSKEDGPRNGPRGPERSKKNSRPGQASKLDQNEDGKVDFAEFQQAPQHRKLSEDEAEDRFEALDKNGDLTLDQEELREVFQGKNRKNKRKEPK